MNTNDMPFGFKLPFFSHVCSKTHRQCRQHRQLVSKSMFCNDLVVGGFANSAANSYPETAKGRERVDFRRDYRQHRQLTANK